MTVEPIPAGLHRKLAEVMGEVGRIPKNGTAPAAMGGFKFVQVGDAADAIRGLLAARAVSMLPTQVDVISESEHVTSKGGTMTTQSIRTTWTLTDGETGETAVIQSLGTGADTGDKFSPKAQTNSMKYALLMGFLLSTGDDPELSDSSDRRARRDQHNPEAAERQGILTAASIPNPITDGLFGDAEVGKGDADFQLRQEAEHGHILIFRLTEGRKGWKVYARGVMAEMVNEYRDGILGYRVQCWGTFSDESFEKGGRTITFQVLNLARLKVGPLDLTAPEPEDEAESLPLFPEAVPA